MVTNYTSFKPNEWIYSSHNHLQASIHVDLVYYLYILANCIFLPFVRDLLVDARVFFDALPFHYFRNWQSRTSYALAACVQFVYKLSWIASQVLLILASIIEYHLKVILKSNSMLKIDDKYQKIWRWAHRLTVFLFIFIKGQEFLGSGLIYSFKNWTSLWKFRPDI